MSVRNAVIIEIERAEGVIPTWDDLIGGEHHRPEGCAKLPDAMPQA